MPIVSIGVDICEVKRIRSIDEKSGQRFLQKVFTAHEISYCENKVNKHTSLAARFAAKEALMKAIGTGLRDGLQWKDTEVRNDPLGRPYFHFYGKVAKLISGRSVFLSLSHTDENAIAYVLIEGEPFQP
ncbi:MAG: holo-[acyl-carrier-protein] synthase [Calditrichales bacterium]|nr:MAG: holo-[acyl-carrier-protein] synthase [Calditrichales bacterium]